MKIMQIRFLHLPDHMKDPKFLDKDMARLFIDIYELGRTLLEYERFRTNTRGGEYEYEKKLDRARYDKQFDELGAYIKS